MTYLYNDHTLILRSKRFNRIISLITSIVSGCYAVFITIGTIILLSFSGPYYPPDSAFMAYMVFTFISVIFYWIFLLSMIVFTFAILSLRKFHKDLGVLIIASLLLILCAIIFMIVYNIIGYSFL